MLEELVGKERENCQKVELAEDGIIWPKKWNYNLCSMCDYSLYLIEIPFSHSKLLYQGLARVAIMSVLMHHN